METLVDVQPGKNVNGNFMGKMQTEYVYVLDRYRYGGVRLYQGEFVFVWNNIVGVEQWSQLFAVLQRLWQQYHRMYRVFIGGYDYVSWLMLIQLQWERQGGGGEGEGGGAAMELSS